MTHPFICHGDDDAVSYVKGIDAGRDSQIKEWLAGCGICQVAVGMDAAEPVPTAAVDPEAAGDEIRSDASNRPFADT